HEFIAQGRPLPKRDIVDTCFHASRAAGPCTATRTALPTVWEKTQLDNRRRSYSLSILIPSISTAGLTPDQLHTIVINQIDPLDKQPPHYHQNKSGASLSTFPSYKCLHRSIIPQFNKAWSDQHHFLTSTPLTINLSVIFPTMNNNQNNGPSQDPPRTPERDRAAGRHDDRMRRLDMTSPSSRRERSRGQYNPPPQPNFRIDPFDNGNNRDRDNGFQFQPPFHQVNYRQGGQLNGGFDYQVNGQQPGGYAWQNYYQNARQQGQPTAGPSRGPEERLRNRRTRQRADENEQRPNAETQTNTVHNTMAARRRAQEIAEQQQIEAEAQAAAQLQRLREQRAQQEAEAEAHTERQRAAQIEAEHRRAAQEEADNLARIAAQQRLDQQRAIEQQRRAEEQAALEAAHAAQVLFAQQQQALPPGRRVYLIVVHFIGMMKV
ncbi:hypothetical protein K466DRAFT_567663, partial [Polyporus arcularius HHB13444]